MKIKTAFFILSIFVISQLAFAGTPMHKLARGVEGVATSPIEYLNQYQIASNEHGIVASSVICVFSGTAMLGKRILNGVYDIVSFPVNSPNDYGLLLSDETETALENYSSLQSASFFPLAKQTI